jgi:mono/diheme cytochrome c family protein
MKQILAVLVIAAFVALAALAPSPGARADEGGPSSTRAGASLTGPTHFLQTDGESLYHVACQVCHMPNGQGGSGAASYPALAGNPKLSASAYPIIMVLHGSKAMPAFNGALSDAQVAAVVSYVRTHFGNLYKDKVSADEVKGLRSMAH